MRLPATLIFDYPTTSAVVAYLLREMSTADRAIDDIDTGEDVVRRALASIPLVRLQEAGVMEILLQLADPEGELTVNNGDSHLIDDMDVESLVQRAIETPVVESGEKVRDADFS